MSRELGAPAPRRRPIGWLLLGLAVGFNLIFLAPELTIGRLSPNDSVLHLAAAERLGASLGAGEPFLDPWVFEWSLGYPIWQSYQPLPHLLAALVLAAAHPIAPPDAAFAALVYLLLALLPVSVFVGARLLGLSSAAAGLASVLVLCPSGAGELARFGIGYGASVWSGSGLFTQLVAVLCFVPCLGLVRRALDSGQGFPLASMALAVTALGHIVFGYVAFVSATVLTLVGPPGERPRRLARLFLFAFPALLLLAWFVVPLFLARGEINRSRWESAHKWDSFGWQPVLTTIASGEHFDHGRPPLLTALLGVGALVALRSARRPLARRLLALTTVWLLLYFGRATWGHLLRLFLVPAELHLHRLQAPVELFAVLLGAWGLVRLVESAPAWRGWAGIACPLAITLAFVPLGLERAAHLRASAAAGRATLASWELERSQVEAAFDQVRVILTERPGRVSAGRAADWGGRFQIGAMKIYALLSRAHFDQVSFLYHSMSLTSDLMVQRDESQPAHDQLFAVRAVIAPAGQPMPGHLTPRGTFGRYAVYESATEGYFGLVEPVARYTGPAGTDYDPSLGWLHSELPARGLVVTLDGQPDGLPGVGRWQPLPVPPTTTPARGSIASETRVGSTLSAIITAVRPCHVLVKTTWHPRLRASVDGRPAAVRKVTPGFAAVPISAGRHEVVVSYRPGPLRPLLLVAGIGLFVATARRLTRPGADRDARRRIVPMVRAIGRRATPRVHATIAIALLAALSLRPLLRGHLIDGHDATEYAPRLSEFMRVLGDGHLPPVWAPDLGNGHGQPLFQFAPPLLYLTAAPLRALGLGLTDSLQLALALLHTIGAASVYRLARRSSAARAVAVTASGMWLFAPYVSLDMVVRAAFAEAAAVAVTPLAILALTRALDRPDPARVATAGGGVALVVLGHNAAALVVLPALALLVAGRVAGDRRLATLVGGFLSLAAGLGLSAYFWLPALREKGLVKTDLLREGFLSWTAHAVHPLQLLWGAWGYGLSIPGTDDGMSFALGPLHVVLGLGGLALGVRWGDRGKRIELATLAAIAGAGAVLATDLSAPIWNRVTTLQYLAYPWRTLMLPAVTLPLLAVPLLGRLPRSGLRVALVALVVVNFSHTEPRRYLTYDDEYYAPGSIAARGINTTTREEYEPISVIERPAWSGIGLRSLGTPVEVLASDRRSAHQSYTVHAETATDVELGTFYYPGWTVRVDGDPAIVSALPVRGTMTFTLPSGRHQVEVVLQPTSIRRWGVRLTAGTVLALALGALIQVARSRAPRRHRGG